MIAPWRLRWKIGSDLLPGEAEPIKGHDGMKLRVFACWMEGEDRETVPMLRSFRGLLGYGEGSTFAEALWECLAPPVLIGLSALFALGLWIAARYAVASLFRDIH